MQLFAGGASLSYSQIKEHLSSLNLLLFASMITHKKIRQALANGRSPREMVRRRVIFPREKSVRDPRKQKHGKMIG